MKGLCYMVLIIAFIIYYQQDPIFTIIIIIIGLGVYFYFKSRKSYSSGKFAFFSKRPSSQNKSTEDLITLMILQQILGSCVSSSPSREKDDILRKENDYEQKIDTIKNEILALLEDK